MSDRDDNINNDENLDNGSSEERIVGDDSEYDTGNDDLEDGSPTDPAGVTPTPTPTPTPTLSAKALRIKLIQNIGDGR